MFSHLVFIKTIYVHNIIPLFSGFCFYFAIVFLSTSQLIFAFAFIKCNISFENATQNTTQNTTPETNIVLN